MQCNRPYGAGKLFQLSSLNRFQLIIAPKADVSANIKNVVSKLNTQKILLSLAENDLITSKTYGACFS